MTRTASLSLLFFAGFVAVACRKGPKTASTEPVTPSTPSAESTEAGSDVTAPATPPLDVGPAAGDREVQRQAVFALFAGELDADTLPEVATEQGQSLDHGLVDRLAPAISNRRTGVRGSATVGAATSDAPIANLTRVSAGMRAGFRACYNRALQERPETAGVVSMVLKVAREGAVTDAKATSTPRLPGGMLYCLEARARAAQFDSPGGKAATVRFNVTFALP